MDPRETLQELCSHLKAHHSDAYKQFLEDENVYAIAKFKAFKGSKDEGTQQAIVIDS